MAILFLTKLLNPSTFYLFSLLLGITCFETGFFEKLSKAVQDSRLKVTGLSIAEILGFLLLLSYRSRYNFNGIADGLIALSLACMVQTFLSRIKLLSNILRKLGEHSANMFLTHNQIYSFYFPGFFYSFKHWSMILLSLVLVTFLLSVLMEAVKEKLHYDRLIGKIFQ